MPTKNKPPANTTQTAPHDSLAENRRLAVVPAASIPLVPTGFVLTPNEERLRRLTRPAEDLRAEIGVALEFVLTREATYRKELGDVPPDISVAKTLRPRLTELQSSRAAADALAAYLRELEEIAYSDASAYLQAIDEEVAHRASKNHALTTLYAPVLRVAQSRSQAIADGVARSRRDAKEQSPGNEPADADR